MGEKKKTFMIRLCALLFIWQIIGVSVFSILTISINLKSTNNMLVFSEKDAKQAEFYSLELSSVIAEEVDELFEIEVEKTKDNSLELIFSKKLFFKLNQKKYQNIFIDLPFSPPETRV